MNEETRVAQLADFTGQQLDSLCTIAENDCLRDIKLGEKSIQAMELLTFLEESIVLSETLQSQLVRDLDVLGLRDVSLLELSDLNGVCRTEKTNLTIIRHHLQDLLHYFLEFSRNKTINFIQNAKLALVKSGFTSRCQIKDPSWRCHNNMYCLSHSDHILIDSSATGGYHALDTLVLAQFFNHETCLHRQLSHWH